MPDDKNQSGQLQQRLKVEQPGKAPLEVSGSAELQNLPGMGRLWIALGLTGTLVVSFLGMMWWSLEQQSATIRDLRQDLIQARRDARDDAKDMTTRYLQTRTIADTRHADIMSKLDKVVLWVEMAVTRALKEMGSENGHRP